MCKHIAAVLYGIGARLDNKPELLFTLRGVDHEELIAADAEKAVAAATSRGKSKRLAADDIGAVFGIEIDAGSSDASSSDSPAGERPGKAVPERFARRRPVPRQVEKERQGNPEGREAAARKTVRKRKADGDESLNGVWLMTETNMHRAVCRTPAVLY